MKTFQVEANSNEIAILSSPIIEVIPLILDEPDARHADLATVCDAMPNFWGRYNCLFGFCMVLRATNIPHQIARKISSNVPKAL